MHAFRLDSRWWPNYMQELPYVDWFRMHFDLISDINLVSCNMWQYFRRGHIPTRGNLLQMMVPFWYHSNQVRVPPMPPELCNLPPIEVWIQKATPSPLCFKKPAQYWLLLCLIGGDLGRHDTNTFRICCSCRRFPVRILRHEGGNCRSAAGTKQQDAHWSGHIRLSIFPP